MKADPKRAKICIVITAASHLWVLYRNQFKYLLEQGFEVTAVSSPGPEHERLRQMGVKTVPLAMKKTPAPLHDLVSLFRLTVFFITNRFDIVSVSTPKASLLAGLAAFVGRQPRIVFTIRGRAYENKTGFARKVFDRIDGLICALSDSVLSVSQEILDDFVSRGLCSREKISLIASGSGNGVDLRRFSASSENRLAGQALRADLGIPDHSIVLLYTGRIRRDKGSAELVNAFIELAEHGDDLHLMMLGSADQVDPLDDDVVMAMANHPRIYHVEWCNDVEQYYAAADIFVLPSYREGLPNVVLEASAMELPVVAFDVVGCREAVKHEETGILCSDINSTALAAAISRLVNNADERAAMGRRGRVFVAERFDSARVWSWLVSYYREQLSG